MFSAYITSDKFRVTLNLWKRSTIMYAYSNIYLVTNNFSLVNSYLPASLFRWADAPAQLSVWSLWEASSSFRFPHSTFTPLCPSHTQRRTYLHILCLWQWSTSTHTRTLISLSVEWRPLSRIMSPLLPWKSVVMSLGWNMSLLVPSDRNFNTDKQFYRPSVSPVCLLGLWINIEPLTNKRKKYGICGCCRWDMLSNYYNGKQLLEYEV